MFLNCKEWQNRRGDLCFFINSFNGDINAHPENVYFCEFMDLRKMTSGQKIILENFFDFLDNQKIRPEIENFKEIAPHTEISKKLDFNIKIYHTTQGKIAGHSVSRNGSYIVYKEHLYFLRDIKGVYKSHETQIRQEINPF